MKPDISIVIPSIRPENLVKVYDSAKLACQSNTFELVIPSPYLIPEELMTKGNVKFIHTYANPTLAFQMAAQLCEGEYLYNTTDDGLIQEPAIDLAVEIFKGLSINSTDMINMVYNEGVLDPDTFNLINLQEPFPDHYWLAHSHADLRLNGIDHKWQICMHFFMKLEYFIKLGGFDCSYEYCNHALHDLAFRAQANGSKIHKLPMVAFLCSHLPGRSGDHGPVNDAQLGPDLLRFNSIYNQPRAAYNRINLDFRDWVGRDQIWSRRFDKANLKVSK